MQRIIDQSIEMASNQFKSFGFKDEQILPLIQSGRRDLTKELTNLQGLLSSDNIDKLSIDLSIHAIKGLVSTMGNKELAKRLSKIYNEEEDGDIKIEEIKTLLEL